MGNPAKPAETDAETAVERTLEQEYDNTESETDTDLDLKPVPEKKPATVASKEKAGGTEKESEGQSEKPKHSARMLRLAAELDISEDECEELTPEALDILIHRETRRQLKEARESKKTERANDTAAEKRKKDSEEIEIKWGRSRDSEGVEREFTDDDIHSALLPVFKRHEREIAELKALIAGQSKSVEEDRMNKFSAAFDVSASRYKKTLGEGTLADLQDTPFAKKRAKIFKEVCEIMTASPRTSLDKAVELAVRDVYGIELGKPKKLATVASDDDDDEDDQRSRRGASYKDGKVTRPTSRKGKPAKGREAAEAAVEAWLNENGQGGGGDDDDDPESEY